MLETTLIIVSLAVLIIATITDLKTYEVPDWLNYAGITAGIGIHLIFSLQQWSWWPIASSLIGLAITFGLASLMFYTGQWGGGDAKLLMAMGALIGFQADKMAFGTSYLINLVFIGGAWGLLYSASLAIRNIKNFWKTYKKTLHEKTYKKLRITTIITVIILIIMTFLFKEYRLEILILAIITYALTHIAIFIKSTEQSCMHKWITPDKLTEGDWLLKPVTAGKQKIMPNKLGLEQEQVDTIKKLYAQKKIEKVLVKYGIPFAPAFLIAFITTIIWNNIVLAILF